MTSSALRLWRFRSILVGLVLSGLVCSYYGVGYFGHSLESLGHALIIAGILGLTVDSYVKEHLLKEASQDIAKYLIGYQLPDDIQGRIKHLMATQLVARNFHLHYKLTPLPEDVGKVMVQIDLSYVVENISNEDLKYKQYIYVDKYSTPRLLELRCDSNDEHARYYLGEQDLVPQTQYMEQDPQALSAFITVYGQEITLRSSVRNKQVRYRFGARYTYCFPVDYFDYFEFGDPTIGVTITAEYPPDLMFQGPSEPVYVNRWENHVNRWENERVFLTGEQVTVQWCKKNPQSNSSNNVRPH